MTAGGKLIAMVPAALLLSWAMSLGAVMVLGEPLFFVLFLFFVYLLPPLLYRVHGFFIPLKPGLSRISDASYSAWWGGYNLQSVYNALPWIEALLMCVPGLYSSWLRLWGSRLGRGIYWTPTARVADRGLLRIGSQVVIGHRVEFFGHVIKAKSERMLLYVGEVTVGDNVFIGAGSHIGPGAVIADNTQLKIRTDIFPNEKTRPQDHA